MIAFQLFKSGPWSEQRADLETFVTKRSVAYLEKMRGYLIEATEIVKLELERRGRKGAAAETLVDVSRPDEDIIQQAGAVLAEAKRGNLVAFACVSIVRGEQDRWSFVSGNGQMLRLIGAVNVMADKLSRLYTVEEG